MGRKSYYVILGVSPTEDRRGIRAAYCELARRLHPDVAGEQATSAFHEATEAYQVLSDPQRRRDYDASLRRTRQEGPIGEPSGLSDSMPTEPLAWRPMSILEHPDRVSPSFDAMFDRFLRNFTRLGAPKSEQLEPLDFEVVLTPHEAKSGSVVPISVPCFRRCPQCGGSGRDLWSGCARCGEQGWLRGERIVPIRVAPEVPSGSVLEVPLEHLGISNFYLRLHIFVQG
jgi:molecular chaperone DnaJ